MSKLPDENNSNNNNNNNTNDKNNNNNDNNNNNNNNKKKKKKKKREGKYTFNNKICIYAVGLFGLALLNLQVSQKQIKRVFS